jgi:hypothetical protein
MSPHLLSSPFISSHLFSPLLTSAKLFSAVLTCSQLISALVSSSHLISRSDHLSSSLAQNLLQNRISAPKPKKFDFEAYLKANVTGKWNMPKTRNMIKN